MPPRSEFPRSWPWRALRTLAGAGTLWWILSEGTAASWIVGVPAVVLATASVLILNPRGGVPVRIGAFLAFTPFFIRRSLAGGVDVASRALRPGRSVASLLVVYPLRLPATGPSRVFFVNTLSLLPGTLAAQLQSDTLVVHSLVEPLDMSNLRLLEAHVAAIFDVPLLESSGGEAP